MVLAHHQTEPAVFSPLAKAILDSFGEGVVVFDKDGRLAYVNEPARQVVDGLDNGHSRSAEELMPKLARLGGRIAPIRVGDLAVGEAVYLPKAEGPHTLADRERDAIVKMLNQTGWRLAETARQLGISRTTLWRRLRSYGLHRDGRNRLARSQ